MSRPDHLPSGIEEYERKHPTFREWRVTADEIDTGLWPTSFVTDDGERVVLVWGEPTRAVYKRQRQETP